MMIFHSLGRKVALALVCALLAACTQTASSSYNGNLTDTNVAAAEKKREAARARAAERKEARRQAFLKKREGQRTARAKTEQAAKGETPAAKRAAKRQAAREARKQARAERLAKRNGQTTLRRTGKKTVTKKKPKVVAKARKSVKTVRKGKVQKVAPTKAAYAPGAARRISTNNKPWNCVPGRLKAVLADVSKRFGAITVNSTHRSGAYNRKVGGKRGSYHLKCAAVDFRVRGKTKGLTRYLAMHPKVGGYKRYRSGFYHIDTGPKRTW